MRALGLDLHDAEAYRKVERALDAVQIRPRIADPRPVVLSLDTQHLCSLPEQTNTRL